MHRTARPSPRPGPLACVILLAIGFVVDATAQGTSLPPLGAPTLQQNDTGRPQPQLPLPGLAGPDGLPRTPGRPLLPLPGMVVPGDTAADGSIRHLVGTTVADRLALITTSVTNRTGGTAESTQAEQDDRTTAPQVGVRRVVSRAEEDLPPVGNASIWLRRAHLTADVWNNLAVCTLELDWVNQEAGNREATYYLPISPTMMFTGLELSIRSSMEEGSHEDFEDASKTYETIVQRSLDPALLEVFRTDVARLRVFPLEPGRTKRVRVHWIQMLDFKDGRFRFSYPTELHRYLGYTTGAFSAAVRVATGFERRMIADATTGNVTTAGKTVAVRLSGRAFSRLGDGVQVAFEPRHPEEGFADVVRGKNAAGEGFFVIARYLPAASRSPVQARPAAPAVDESGIRALSFADGGVALDGDPGKEVCARTFPGSAGQALTLFVGRCSSDAVMSRNRKGSGSRDSVARVGAELEALWAGQQMEAISEVLTAADAEQAEAIQELGHRHGVMTPFSALLVVEPGLR